MNSQSLPGPDEIQALRAGQDAETQQIVIRYQGEIRQEIRETVQDHEYEMWFTFPNEVFHNVRIQLKDWVNEQPGYTANWTPAKNIQVQIPKPQEPQKSPQSRSKPHPVAVWTLLIALLCGILCCFYAVHSHLQSNIAARKERHEITGFVTSYTYDYPTHNLIIYFSDDPALGWTRFTQLKYDSGDSQYKPLIPTDRKLVIIHNGLGEYISYKDISMPKTIPL